MVCASRQWAGVDSVWEQRKLEARKVIDGKRAAESPAASARGVRRFLAVNAPWKIRGVSIMDSQSTQKE